MTRIRVVGMEFEVKSKLVDSGVSFPNDESWTRHNKFKVKVCRQGANKCRSFDFYGSHSDMEKGKQTMNAEDIRDAFRSFLDDSISGMMDFQEFCSELGYDKDSRRAEKIWKATKKSLAKAEDLGFTENELYDAVDELNE